MQMSHHQTVPQSYSRSSQSTPSPSTTTANITNESTDNGHFNPIVKMEVADDDDDDEGGDEPNICMEQKSCDNGNFNYVGDYIAAELNKLPLRDAFVLKNILIREVLTFSEKLMITASLEKQWNAYGIVNTTAVWINFLKWRSRHEFISKNVEEKVFQTQLIFLSNVYLLNSHWTRPRFRIDLDCHQQQIVELRSNDGKLILGLKSFPSHYHSN